MIGLNKSEEKVFKKLTLNEQSVADVVRKSKLPRMTVYTTLLRLEKKRVAQKVKSASGKRVLWRRADTSSIASQLSKTEELFMGKAFSLAHESSTFKGKEEVGKVLMDLTVRRDSAPMYAIQNAHTWVTWIQVMGREWVNKHNRAVVTHKLVAFTIHSPSAPEKIKSDQEVIDAYKGRHGNSRVIPEAYLKKDMALYIFDDTLLFVDLGKVEATLVVNKDMAHFVTKLFTFMFEKASVEEFFLKYNRVD